MRCLLDENLPHKLRSGLSEFDSVTVQFAGFSGLKNGELLKAAEAAGFDVLVTGDKTFEYEQNMKDRRIAVVAFVGAALAIRQRSRRERRRRDTRRQARVVHAS